MASWDGCVAWVSLILVGLEAVDLHLPLKLAILGVSWTHASLTLSYLDTDNKRGNSGIYLSLSLSSSSNNTVFS